MLERYIIYYADFGQFTFKKAEYQDVENCFCQFCMVVKCELFV
jgi:hypothetical protein